MICVSIGKVGLKKCLKTVSDYELCELRLDLLKLDREELKKIFYASKELIASYRKDKLTKAGRALLEFAINGGVSFVDIDINWNKADKDKILKLARSKGVKTIISYHNNKITPSLNELNKILVKCKKHKPEIIKISCMSKSNADNLRLLSLLDQPEDIIVIGMGAKGQVTRVVAPLLGSFCTYVCLDQKNKTAPGQFSIGEIKKLCYSL